MTKDISKNKVKIFEPGGDFAISLADKILEKINSSKNFSQNNYLLKISGYIIEVIGSINYLDKTIILIQNSVRSGTISEKSREFEYHLGNFYLRWYLFDQRVDQLVNSTFLGISEENNTIHREIRVNEKTHKVHPLLRELDNFPEIQRIREIRKKFTHRKYEVYPHMISFVYEELKKEGIIDPNLFMLEKFSQTRINELEKIVFLSKNTFNKICLIINEYIFESKNKLLSES